MTKSRTKDQFIYALIAVIFAACAVIIIRVRPVGDLKILNRELTVVDDSSGILDTTDLDMQASGL